MTEIHLSDEHQAFIDKLLKAGFYKDADAIVAGALRLLQRKDEEFFELQRLIQEGIDDVEAGRVHSYDTAGEFLADIRRVSAERKSKTGTGY